MKAKNTKDSLINQKRDRYESPFGFMDPMKKSDAPKSNQASPTKDKTNHESLKKLETKLIGTTSQTFGKTNISNSSTRLDPVAYVLASNQAKLKEGITRLDKEKVNNQSSLDIKTNQGIESAARDASPSKYNASEYSPTKYSPTKYDNLPNTMYNEASSPEKLAKSINVSYITSNDHLISGKHSMPNTMPNMALKNQDSLALELAKNSNATAIGNKTYEGSPVMDRRTNGMYRSLDLEKSGLTNTGISNLRPTDAKILKSHGVDPVELSSRNRGRKQSNDDDGDYGSPLGTVKEVELEEIEKYKRSTNFKSVEREKNLDRNIWRRIDEFNQKKTDQEQKSKQDKKKDAQEEWLTTLQQQIMQKKVKKVEEKEDEIDHYKRRVALDLKLQMEDEEKRRMHRDHVREVEIKNYYEISKEKDVVKKVKEQEKDKEIQRLNENIDEYLKQQNRVKEEQLKGKKELNKIMTENILSRNHKKSNEKAEENEKNIKIIEGLVDQKLREEEEYHQFREWLKDKSRKMRDPDVKADKNADTLRKYGEPNKNAQAQEGVMKFLYSDRYNEKLTSDNKVEQRTVLNSVYEAQKREFLDKNKSYKEYINEQNALWKDEEHQMNLREELTVQAAKLKKQIQKEDLDAQREIDEKVKSGNVGPHDIWVNRKTLKELKSVPEEYSRKIAYLRS